MSALDRAFIRAYRRPAAPAQKTDAAPSACDLPEQAPTRAAMSPIGHSVAVLPTESLASTMKSSTHELGQSQEGESRACMAAHQKGTDCSPIAVDCAAGATGPISGSFQGDSSIAASLGALLDEALRTEDPQGLPPAGSPAPESATVEATSAAARHELPPVPDNCHATAAATETPAASTLIPPPPARNVTTGPAAGENPWSPLLQVDRVVWPPIHKRLQGTARTATDAMTDALQAIGDAGRKTIGLASCVRGEGVTTLLSAAARCLLERGRKVVLVDSHWDNPQLAKSVGLLPQIGWEETLAGGLPLEEIVIESLADGLAVLPVREPPASEVTKTAISASLGILARKYDFVLVDLGTLGEIEDQRSPSHHVAACMDALVIVQSVQMTPPHHLSEVRKRLAASNMRYAGTIQNFVAG